jgi:acyl-coenzyme A thioesterase PaaI-like protein
MTVSIASSPSSNDVAATTSSSNSTSNDSSQHQQYHDDHHLPQEPQWVQQHIDSWTEGGTATRLVIPEWEHNHNVDHHIHHDARNNNNHNSVSSSYRHKHGWHGRDFLHDRFTSAVYIRDYFVQYNTNNTYNNNNGRTAGTGDGGGGPRAQTQLYGIVSFTKHAESHCGYCHGGSMTAIMDDVIGWMGFCATGTVRPWSGFTVQVNTCLKRPVKVNSVLLIHAQILKVERRKVFVQATLSDPANNNNVVVHAEGDGIVVLNRGILLPEQEVDEAVSTASASMSRTSSSSLEE